MSAFHPAFVSRIQEDSFLDSTLLDALETSPPVSIRKHPLKTRVSFEGERSISWCSNGFHLPQRPVFTLEPLFHAGSFYPQEAGSMLLEKALMHLDLPDQPKVLDLCAAPGGKSTLIASFLNESGLLVSNEVIRQRSRILQETTTKWGYSNCIVTNNDPADFDRLPHFFDLIVVDAPCSGEGMFRKDKQAREEWSPENVELCAARQKRILADVWQSLKPGGFLIYSTCTFNAHENESNVNWMLNELGANLIPLDAPEAFKTGRNGVGLYGIPGISETEGFFLALVQKHDEVQLNRIKKGTPLPRQKDLLDCERYADLNGFSLFNWQQSLLAVPSNRETEFLVIQQQLRIVKWGTSIGEIARKGIIPHHDLAMNPALRAEANQIELDRADALRYLHGDTFSLDGKPGFALVTHLGEPLGRIKHLGNRFNNLYPKEWRIRMDVNQS